MKTILKVIAALVVLLIVIIVAVVIIIANRGNDIVKAAIERGGTYATETTTTVGSVNVKVFKGTFGMSDLEIANPAGFKTDHFLQLKDTSVSMDIASINTPVIRVPSVTFDGIDVILDKGGNPSNYNTILNSLKRFESSDTKAAPENKDAKKVAIDTLKLTNIDIRVANMPGVSLLTGDVAINIPSIELKDLGKDEPMTAAEIVNLVIKTVLTAAVEAGGGIIPGDILGELGNGLNGLSTLSDMGITAIGSAGEIVGDQIGNVLENAGQAVNDLTKDLPEDLGKGLEDATKGVTDKAGKAVDDAKNELEKGLGNLLGGKKKKEDEPKSDP